MMNSKIRNLLPLILIMFTVLCPHQAYSIFYESGGNSRDCFFITTKANNVIVGSYETFFEDDSLRVTLEVFDEKKALSADYNEGGVKGGKQKKQLFYSSSKSDNFKVEMKDGGTCMLCITNLLSYQQTITFSFYVYLHASEVHPHDVATEDQTKSLEELSENISEMMNAIGDQQLYSLTREEIHTNTAETTNSRVLWGAIAQFFVIMILAAFQFYYMRSFFEVKTIV